MTSEIFSQAASEQGVLSDEIGNFHFLYRFQPVTCFEHIPPPQIVMNFAGTTDKYFKAGNPKKGQTENGANPNAK